MWPFDKKVKAECCSGVIACDGKHHTWTEWHEEERDYTLFRSGSTLLPKPIIGIIRIQRHHCVICGYIEEETINT
jgi:hypothetical protein